MSSVGRPRLGWPGHGRDGKNHGRPSPQGITYLCFLNDSVVGKPRAHPFEAPSSSLLPVCKQITISLLLRPFNQVPPSPAENSPLRAACFPKIGRTEGKSTPFIHHQIISSFFLLPSPRQPTNRGSVSRRTYQQSPPASLPCPPPFQEAKPSSVRTEVTKNRTREAPASPCLKHPPEGTQFWWDDRS